MKLCVISYHFSFALYSVFLVSGLFLEMRHLESNRISQNTVTKKMMVKTVTFLQKTNRVVSSLCSCGSITTKDWTQRGKWRLGFYFRRKENKVLREEHAVTCAGEELPSAARCRPALGIVSVSLSRSQRVQINRQAEQPGSRGRLPPERELSRPSAGPDTTATPTKQLFTPKHPEEEPS